MGSIHLSWCMCNAGMFGFFFTKGPVTCFEDAKQADTAKFGRFHRGMLEHGIYLAPSAYEVALTLLLADAVLTYMQVTRHLSTCALDPDFVRESRGLHYCLFSPPLYCVCVLS